MPSQYSKQGLKPTSYITHPLCLLLGLGNALREVELHISIELCLAILWITQSHLCLQTSQLQCHLLIDGEFIRLKEEQQTTWKYGILTLLCMAKFHKFSFCNQAAG